MKKTLTVFAVLLLVSATVFAAPTFSGTFGYGYKFGFDGSIENADYLGDSGEKQGGYAYLKTSLDYISLDLRASTVRSAIDVTGTVDVTKMLNDTFELELPVTLKAKVGNQAFSASDTFAYNVGGSDDDEISMNGSRASMPIGLTVGYGDLITVNGGVDFVSENKTGILEVQAVPVEGIKGQLAYAFGQSDELTDGVYTSDFQVAGLVDVKALAGLDFDLAASGYFEADVNHFADSFMLKGSITGGYKAVSGYVEYTFAKQAAGVDSAKGHSVYAGASYAIASEKAPTTLSLGFSATDLKNAAAFGGTLTAKTTLCGMTFQARLGISDFTDIKTGYVRVASVVEF